MEEYLQLLGEIHTDLALESHEIMTERSQGREISGIRKEQEKIGDAVITRVLVETEEAAKILGKEPGLYVTLEIPGLLSQDRDKYEEISIMTAKELEKFIASLHVGDDAQCLVVGLGNDAATPDAIGPKVIEHILVSRHLTHLTPPEKKNGLRPVCAIAPGVLGTTGIETGEVVQGVVQKIRPDFIVVVDALAARTTSRLGTTIQLSNVGIDPGSGLGNRRIGINARTMGVPVIALGIPTVIEAVTIIHDALQQVAQSKENVVDYRVLQQREIVNRVLSPYLNSLIVTPKEVDVLVNDISTVVAGALNIALHPAVSPGEVFRYLN